MADNDTPPGNRHPSKDDWLQSRAQELRRNSTYPERRLWAILRDRRLAGLKFRRQVPVGNFIVDYLCIDARLIIEIDGESHRGRGAADQDRQQQLVAWGFHVLRFSNDDVIHQLDAVVDTILKIARSRLNST